MTGQARIHLIIPAAGRSARMGAENKLFLPLGDRTVLEHTVSAALDAGVGDVIVVTGAEAGRILEALQSYPVRFVHNEAFTEGMASSLRAGVQAANREAAGFGILPGDMPFIRAETISRLSRFLEPDGIVVPRCEGRTGHPVLFSRTYRDELLSLTGDVGARSVVSAHPHAVVTIDVDDRGTLRDIDTMDDYRSAERRDNEP